MAAWLRQFVSADFWRHGDRAWYGSFGLSVAVHLGAILLLGVTWTAPPPQPSEVPVETRWSPGETEIRVTELETPVDLESSRRDEAGGRRHVSDLLQRHPGPAAEIPAPPVESQVILDRPGELFEEGRLAETVGGVTGGLGQLASSGFGQGDGDATGDGGGGGFFGIGSPGRRFVYVVDCSRSMNHPHPGEVETRFKRLQLELVRSVGTMTAEQEFYIIFFNDRPIPMPASSLQPARPRLKKHFLRWVVDVRADGETDPRRALQMAMRLRPDVIYFLSDGSFEPGIARDLKEIRQPDVSIHTFAFGNRDAEKLLKSIATRNQGEYHFVP